MEKIDLDAHLTELRRLSTEIDRFDFDHFWQDPSNLYDKAHRLADLFAALDEAMSRHNVVQPKAWRK